MTPFESRFDIANPVALVTGAGKPRVGQAIAARLHKDGCRVMLHAHRNLESAKQTAQTWSEQGEKVKAIGGDLADPNDISHIVAQTLESFGRIDMLIHTAAIWWPISLEDTTADDLDQFLNVNTKATFLLTQQAGLAMTRQPNGGSVLLLGDTATEHPYPDYAAYLTSKAALPAMIRVFAVELASRHPRINVNGLLPGPITLPDSLSDQQIHAALEPMLTRPAGTPQDVASLAVPLLLNPHLTATAIPLDGGRSLASPRRTF